MNKKVCVRVFVCTICMSVGGAITERAPQLLLEIGS